MTKIQETFTLLNRAEPSQTFQTRVLERLAVEQERISQRRFFMTVAGVVTSLVLSVYGVYAVGSTLVQSDFWQMLSLLFSDATAVTALGQDFFLSLLEMLPAVQIALVLAPLFALLLSLSVLVTTDSQRKYHFA